MTYLPERTKTVTIAGVQFNVDTPDGQLHVHSIDGWGDKTVRRNSPSRLFAHGTVPQQGFGDQHIYTVVGRGKATSPGAAIRMEDSLNAILADGSYDTMAVFDPWRGYSLNASVALKSNSVVEERPGWYMYRIAVLTDDPRKYSDTTMVSCGAGETLSFNNVGTADSAVFFTVNGSSDSGFQITDQDSGRQLVYSTAFSGEVTINASTGEVLLNGVDAASSLTTRQWDSIGPKTTATFAFAAPGGSGTLDLKAASAWW